MHGSRAARPRVTVVVPTYNRAALLGECLDSLLAQTLPPAELIVVNDGSTDQTSDLLTSYGARLTAVTTPQHGKAVACNVGLEHATGDYVWFFDDDDVALPECLERFVAPLEASPAAGFSYARFAYAPTGPDGRIGNATHHSPLPDLAECGFLVSLLKTNFLGGAALMARRGCYDTVGGFDPELIRSQDYDMAIRLARVCTGVPVPGPPPFIYRSHTGERGSSRDRFSAATQFLKWLQYDQRIFHRLHAELPLAEYLPPGLDIASDLPRAILQRFAIACSKLLENEALSDLAMFVALPGAPLLGRAERSIARAAAQDVPYYGAGSLFDAPAFCRKVRAVTSGSVSGRAIRREFLRGAIGRMAERGEWRMATFRHSLPFILP
jgi:glycosyltransferase involved in cell wall biosynthesis